MPLNQGGLRAAKVGNENQRAPDLSGMAESLMTPTIRQGAFDGAAEGMNAMGKGLQNLGEGGIRVAAVLKHAQDLKAEFQDDVSVATYRSTMSQKFQEYQGTLAGKPESEYNNDWQKISPKLQEDALKDLPLSNNGLKRIKLFNAEFTGQTGSTLIAASNRDTVDRGTGVMLASAQSYENAGKTVEARGALGKLVGQGAITQNQMDAQVEKWDNIINENTLTGLMQQDPLLFNNHVKEFVRTQKSDFLETNFTGPDKRIKLLQWEQKSNAYLQQIQNESEDELDDALVAGTVTKAEEIEMIDKKVGWGAKKTRSFIDALAVEKLNTKEGQAEYMANYDSLWISSVNYDPATDDNVGTKRMEILRNIRRQAISDERQPLLDNLREAVKNGKTPQRQRSADLQNTIDDLATQRILITAPDDKTATSDEKAQYIIDLNAKKTQLKATIIQYIKDNPKIDPVEDSKWIGTIVSKQIEPQAVGVFASIRAKADQVYNAITGLYGTRGKQPAEATSTAKIDAALPAAEARAEKNKTEQEKAAQDQAAKEKATFERIKKANPGKSIPELQAMVDQEFVLPNPDEQNDVITPLIPQE
jgi:hypothetical protein